MRMNNSFGCVCPDFGHLDRDSAAMNLCLAIEGHWQARKASGALNATGPVWNSRFPNKTLGGI